MDKNLKHAEVHRLASLELNLLNYSPSLPPTVPVLVVHWRP